MLKMTDLHDLQTRAGHADSANREINNQRGTLLSEIQNGMSTLRDRLIQMRLDNDQLAKENIRLKQIVEQLLEARESDSEDAWQDTLNGLDVQLNVLLELSSNEGEAPGENLGMGRLRDAAGTGADADEPSGAVSCETGGPSPDGSGSLSDIQDRVRALSAQVRGDYGQTDVPRSKTESSGSEPERVAHPETGKSFGGSASQNQVSRTLGKETQAPGAPDSPERKAFNRPIETATHTAHGALPKPRMRFDAEVDYALGILRRLKREGQSFSVEQVRDLINGKFDLGLTHQHDAQITASLSKQDDVGPSAAKGAGWKFGTA